MRCGLARECAIARRSPVTYAVFLGDAYRMKDGVVGLGRKGA